MDESLKKFVGGMPYSNLSQARKAFNDNFLDHYDYIAVLTLLAQNGEYHACIQEIRQRLVELGVIKTS